jgi:hypothetical protein
MGKIKILLNISMFACMILVFIIKFNLNFRYALSEVIDPKIEIIYKDDTIGSIYKIETLHIPGDSLVEYFWDNSHILSGNIHYNVYDSVNYSSLSYIVETFKNEEITFTAVKIGENVLIFYSIDRVEMGKKLNIVFNYKDKKCLYIYGPDYTFDEACRVAQLIIFGDVNEYDITVQKKFYLAEGIGKIE